MNFIDSLSRDLLEELAQGLAQSNCTHRLTKLVDQSIKYYSIEDNLFVTNQPDLFKVLHSSKSLDDVIATEIDATATSIFCSLLSMGGPAPLLAYLNGDERSEAIAQRLESKVKSHLINYKENSCFFFIFYHTPKNNHMHSSFYFYNLH